MHVLACSCCSQYVHPGPPLCPSCLGPVTSVRVSGRGHLVSYTINFHPWHEGDPVPYVVALVNLVEDPTLRIVSNLFDCDIDDVVVGLAVIADYRFIEGVWLPVFRPESKTQ